MTKIKEEVLDCFKRGIEEYNIEIWFDSFDIVFEEKVGNAIGRCVTRGCKNSIECTLIFDEEIYNKNKELYLNKIVKHEVAHALEHLIAYQNEEMVIGDHGDKFMEICRFLGGEDAKVIDYEQALLDDKLIRRATPIRDFLMLLSILFL